ncbi:uncharacterized protein LOC110835115 isoform X3 [Zootermopsis nevadensis]|uniref:Uncharacterized protein n=1 Tax=Zootermopsis nevadensis TaxID=136037 RepID=A0A067R3S7_ZOONE|nr:uncharacterized protein LOC110835115 isoform X3 [Zootermopsis nevadensis]XP_021930714.1 uncharacterized protein LOC110835115 isoform X3 [Zootermopsis nevadensis]XP_021930715.1 uncharacterized protein LOC110835115 isoform X3 [Zootermopsis nevadensis]XP_021930716.1 uncharacterized protein LOC110835115 isoform X3 [Zootermopsis nevadensis]KDR13809.1 hypothetical protein L798_12108 [Zootermopsis nevadensis]
MRPAAVFLLATMALAEGNVSAEPFQLAKLVFTLSRPGAFNKTHSVFGGEFDAPPDVTSCPLSKEGLACRQAEARRIIDNCPGGDCEGCDSCDENRARTWPHCCQYKSLCCSELAKACQICKVTSLQTFCKKYFKRCF